MCSGPVTPATAHLAAWSSARAAKSLLNANRAVSRPIRVYLCMSSRYAVFCLSGQRSLCLQRLQGMGWLLLSSHVLESAWTGLSTRPPCSPLSFPNAPSYPSIHDICIRECGCQLKTGNPPSRAEQLLQNGWYPATTTAPDSCATLRALELFRAQNVAGNLSGDSFVGALVALTDPTNQTWVAVRFLVLLEFTA